VAFQAGHHCGECFPAIRATRPSSTTAMNRRIPRIRKQQEIEEAIRHGTWQEQAEALQYCQSNPRDTYRTFRKPDGSEFKNLIEFAGYCGIRMRAMYLRLEIAREEERFKLIFERADINPELARVLYQADFETYVALVWALKAGLDARTAEHLAASEQPGAQIRKLIEDKLRELSQLIEEGKEILSEINEQ